MEITFRASYRGFVDGPVDLFTTERMARFVWNPAAGRFVLDVARSPVKEDYLEWLSELGVSGDFLRHYHQELLVLAKRGSADQKLWLRCFLNSRGDETAETKALRRAVRGVGRCRLSRAERG